MKIKLNKIPKSILDELKAVGAYAANDGVKAYLVGGAVRDVVLGEAPLDYDVVVEGDAIKFAEAWAKKHDVAVVTYPQFGTATVTYADGLALDFVTARRETYAKPGAFPKVVPSDMHDDLYRRDFSINAIAASLHPDSLGEVLDYFHGLEDIEAKQLRVMHPLSFIDDPTRILRLIRYQVRLGFNIEKATLGLLNEALQKNIFQTISKSRFQNEFKRIKRELKADAMIQQCAALGI